MIAGSFVEVVGLLRATELNGQIGVVLGNATMPRLQVQLSTCWVCKSGSPPTKSSKNRNLENDKTFQTVVGCQLADRCSP